MVSTAGYSTNTQRGVWLVQQALINLSKMSPHLDRCTRRDTLGQIGPKDGYMECHEDTAAALPATEAPEERKDDVCPWDSVQDLTSQPGDPAKGGPQQPKKNSASSRKNSSQMDSGGSSSDVSVAVVDVSERLRKCCVVEAPLEERVVARIQTVRKYSTVSFGRVADSRRSSVTNRPSVSSIEDVMPQGAPEDTTKRTNKLSINVSRDPCQPPKKSGRKWSLAPTSCINAVPLLEVRDVTEPQAGPSDITTARPPQRQRSNDVCPWEDELVLKGCKGKMLGLEGRKDVKAGSQGLRE
uniref:Uncharacterized protein n=1 Tax=Timema monikensis TaxID=170555 RepID=A0A7R9EB15_9NEOP|nr:unnamed protein product [Timema monikensis]